MNDIITGLIEHAVGLTDDQVEKMRAAAPAAAKLVEDARKIAAALEELNPVIEDAKAEWLSLQPALGDVEALINHAAASTTDEPSRGPRAGTGGG